MFLYLKKLQEEWSLKAPEIQKVNDSGISLCNLISAVTTPAKAIAAVKSGRCFISIRGKNRENWAHSCSFYLCVFLFKLIYKIISEI